MQLPVLMPGVSIVSALHLPGLFIAVKTCMVSHPEGIPSISRIHSESTAYSNHVLQCIDNTIQINMQSII